MPVSGNGVSGVADDRRGVIRPAMLLWRLSTSVTCGPVWPGPTRTSRVSPGGYGADAAPREHTPVEEAVAGLIGKLDEPKSLLGAEPFDDCAY